MIFGKGGLTKVFRYQSRNKTLSCISILGIILGHTVFFLIVSYIWYEKSYERFNPNADNIYRVSYTRYDQGTMQYNTANSFFPVGHYLKENSSEVVNYTTVARNFNISISSNDEAGQPFYFNEEKSYYASSSFLSMFSFPILKGNSHDLDQPNTVFITNRIAKKYFGNQEAIGKIIKVDGTTNYLVAGVLKDLPSNSHLKFDFLFSLPTHLSQLKSWIDITNHWYGYDLFYTYIQLRDKTSPKVIEKILPGMVEKNYGDKLRGAKQRDIFAIQKITDIHLNSNLEWETETPGNGQALNILISFAIFILLTTWVNFINLNSSQAADRAKEVGIRKTLGGSANAVILKFFREIALVNLISINITAVLLAILYFLLPQPSPVFPIEIYESLQFWLVITCVTLFSVVVTSLISALFIARFRPIDTLKGKLLITPQGLIFRKLLIGFQFIVSFILMTGALIIYDQSSFLMKKNMGLDHTAVLSLKFPKIFVLADNAETRINTFRQQLRGLKWVKDITSATDMPAKEITTFGSMYRPALGKSDEKAYFRVGVDDNYFLFFKIKLLAGRLFSKAIGSEKSSIILNESAVKKLGFTTPAEVLGTTVKTSEKEDGNIIGVVSDFNYRSVKVKPVATMFNYQHEASYFFLKLYENELDTQNHLTDLDKEYSRLFPGNPFEFVFLDDLIKLDLQPDTNFAIIFGVFSVVSVILSLIGLLGLVIVDLKQRVKEMGIRKVVGANMKDIMLLITGKFFMPLGIALFIGIPVSAWGFSNWINHYYVYHITLSIYYFIIPALILPLLAMIVVAIQVIKVNGQSITKSLKYD